MTHVPNKASVRDIGDVCMSGDTDTNAQYGHEHHLVVYSIIVSCAMVIL